MIHFQEPTLILRPDRNSIGSNRYTYRLVEIQKRHMQALLMSADNEYLVGLMGRYKNGGVEMGQNLGQNGHVLGVDRKAVFEDRLFVMTRGHWLGQVSSH